MRRHQQEPPPVVPVLRWREVPYAGEDLLPVFEELRQDAFPWLLDSALPHRELGRFSFAGADPYLVLSARGRRLELDQRRAVEPGSRVGTCALEGDPFELARRLLRRATPSEQEWPPELPFVAGAVGHFGYELAEQVDVTLLHGRDDLGFPDLTLLFVDRLLALDHAAGRAFALGLGFAADAEEAGRRAAQAADAYAERLALAVRRAGPEAGRRKRRGPGGDAGLAERRRLLATRLPESLSQSFDAAGYAARVRALQREIADGNVYEANLTQRMVLPFAADPWQLYRALRRQSPAPFACYLELPNGAIVGSSPERFLCLDAAGAVESRPIKGTRPRGRSREQDDALAAELVGSAKDRAENLMIVDLVRNDLGRVCEIGSVRVPELMAIEAYASVFQLVSTVTGQLAEGRDAIDLIRAAFPPGSMTGAPKIAAMRLLDALEPVRRGVYSGAVGYLDVRGGLDLSVVIRTLLVVKDHAYLHVGGAVVADSEPAAEYAETLDKARALLAAVACATRDRRRT